MTVNFKQGLRTMQEKEAVKRHPEPGAAHDVSQRSPAPAARSASRNGWAPESASKCSNWRWITTRSSTSW
jgi:hypothetical protein